MVTVPHFWCKWLKWNCVAIWDSNEKDDDKLKRWHSHCLFVYNLSCTVRSSKNLRAITREPELPELFFLSLQMTRKTAVINDKFNNQTVFTSMCICEHSICNAHHDYWGKLGHIVPTVSPAVQLALGGWASVAATGVTDALDWAGSKAGPWI